MQRIGHLTVFRSGYFLFGAGNPAAYGIDDYQAASMDLIADDPVLRPMISVMTPTQSLVGIAGNFDGGNDAAKTFIGIGLVPSDRDGCASGTSIGAGRRAMRRRPVRRRRRNARLIGGGLARILGLCAALKLANCPAPPARHHRAVATPPPRPSATSPISRAGTCPPTPR